MKHPYYCNDNNNTYEKKVRKKTKAITHCKIQAKHYENNNNYIKRLNYL